jgi:hypothetical protein
VSRWSAAGCRRAVGSTQRLHCNDNGQPTRVTARSSTGRRKQHATQTRAWHSTAHGSSLQTWQHEQQQQKSAPNASRAQSLRVVRSFTPSRGWVMVAAHACHSPTDGLDHTADRTPAQQDDDGRCRTLCCPDKHAGTALHENISTGTDAHGLRMRQQQTTRGAFMSS